VAGVQRPGCKGRPTHTMSKEPLLDPESMQAAECEPRESRELVSESRKLAVERWARVLLGCIGALLCLHIAFLMCVLVPLLWNVLSDYLLGATLVCVRSMATLVVAAFCIVMVYLADEVARMGGV